MTTPKKFDPITSMEELLQTISYIHFESYKLSKQAFGKYFPNAGNMGIFCQSDEEYDFLNKLKEEITYPSDNPNQKYFTLKEPIIIEAQDDIPRIRYEYLYIRKPDPTPYGKNRGDVDFYSDDAFEELSSKVKTGNIQNTELSEQAGVGVMIKIQGEDVPAYISTKKMTELIRVRH